MGKSPILRACRQLTLRYGYVALSIGADLKAARRFLVIEDNPDGRALLTRTLLRKFPECQIVEIDSLDGQETILASGSFDAIVCHRAGVASGTETVRELRNSGVRAPIVLVSGVDRTREALDAGATQFLHYDAWLMLGPMIEDLLRDGGAASEVSSPS